MNFSTTHEIQGRTISHNCGIVSAVAVIGANAVKDFLAGLTDFFGGRNRSYEKELNYGQGECFKELELEAEKLGANAIVGLSFSYMPLGSGMMMISLNGTAVVLVS